MPEATSPGPESTSLRCRFYSPLWRWSAAALFAVSRASLPLCLVLVLIADDPPITPSMLAQLLALVALLPGLASRLIRRAFDAQARIAAETLTMRSRRLQIEVPTASIAAIVPWKLLLPAPGCALRLSSGKALPYVVEADDLAALLTALADAGVATAGAAMSHPTVVYAGARAGMRRGFWHRPAAKFVLFSLPWGALFFNLDQHITFGGSLGQYDLEGLGPYLRSLAVYWGGVAMYLLLFASLLRAVAEAVALWVARAAPSHAMKVRRAAEIACLTIFYGGVPLLVALRLLP